MVFPNSIPFAALKPRVSIFIVAVLLTLIGYGMISRPIENRGIKAGEDLQCYREIVNRMHWGGGYYETAVSELQTRGYPTVSVFNFRLPTLAWLMSRLPFPSMGQALAILMAFITFLVWIRVLKEENSFPKFLVGGLLLLGPLIYSLSPEIFWAHEFWAGTLITLSLLSYARGWRAVSVGCGLFALFLRELTLPFTFLMMVAAYHEGHRREAWFWLLGMIIFGFTLSFHSVMVAGLTGRGDSGPGESWVAFGGWPFILHTARMHPFLLMAPPWLAAVIVPFSLLGFAGWGGPIGSRMGLTVGLYMLSYCFVGKPFNQYWGMMYTNILPLGLLYLPKVIGDLWIGLRPIDGKEIGKDKG